MSSGGIVEFDVLTDDIAERLVRLCCLKAAVEIDGGLDIAVPQQALHTLVFAGPVFEIEIVAERKRGVDGSTLRVAKLAQVQNRNSA